MISFREINIDDADLILKWRMSARVTKFMSTDISNNLELQKEWLTGSYNKPDYYHWIIEINNNPVGTIYISDYSEKDSTTSWGFYIGEEDAVGLGAFIPPHFYNFLFKELEINTINAEVFYNNTNAIGLHLLHGYKFQPQNDKVISKNNKDVLLISMRLSKEDWNFKRFAKNLANFPTHHWNARPDSLKN